MLTLAPNLANAAVIGPTDDWKPLRSGARQLGISDDMVGRILAAGVELTCPGTVYSNGGMLNGWFLGTGSKSFYTNAHGVVDIGLSDRQANFIEPLDKCTVHSYRDLIDRGGRATAYTLAVPQNRRLLEMATFSPQSAPPNQDRARLRLAVAITGSRALPLPDLNRLGLAVGQQLFLVSVAPPAMRAPVIEACHIMALKLNGGPGQIYSDCDNAAGNSAGLYLVRDPSRPGMLVPIALHEGCYEKIGNYKPWDINNNTAVGILLQRNFFALRGA